MRRVVVTGMGIVSSIGNSITDALDSLKAARSGIVFVPHYQELGFRSQLHGDPQFDPTPFIDRRTMRFHGGGTAWAHVAMDQALADSGLEKSEVTDPRTGLVIGSGGASYRAMIRAAEVTKAKGTGRVGPFAVPQTMGSTASANLATHFGVTGLSYSITSACTTSAHCIGNAADLIRWGRQDVMFAGGCEELDWTLTTLFDAIGAMSTGYNDRPQQSSRAFDANRDGFVIAGGAGVVVLEELEHAKARGATIHGEIVGYGATSDGRDMVAPSGEGAVRCMQLALEGIAGKVGYINAHGTSTQLGDRKEIDAIRAVFGDNCPDISSTKSLTGHSIGATGAHETIFTLLMMKHRFLCESANIDVLDPAFGDVPILRARKDNIDTEYALSNSFGFGGTNAALVFRNAEAI